MNFEKKTEQANKERSLSDYLPYSSLIEDDTIVLKDGSLMANWYIEGIAFETKSEDEILQASSVTNQFLSSLEDDRITLHVHRIRRNFKDSLQVNSTGNWFADKFRSDYNDFTGGQSMMATEIYVTMILGEEKEIGDFFSKCFKKAPSMEAENRRLQERLEAFRYQCKRLEVTFSDYNIKRLTSFDGYDLEGRIVKYSEQLQFLNFLCTGIWSDIQVPLGPVNEALGSSQVFVGRDILQLSNSGTSRYCQSIELKTLPAALRNGLLDTLLYPGQANKQPYAFIESQYFKVILRKEGVNLIEKQIRQLRSAGDKAVTQSAALLAAQGEIQGGSFCLGDYGYSLLIFGDDETDCRINTQDAFSKLNKEGFAPFISTLTAGPSFLSILPGNQKWTPRPIRITSLNFSDFSPFHNFLPGKRDHNPWGQAIALLPQISLQPYYLNLHATNRFVNSYGEPDAGSTVVLGMTGAGKTALLSFIATSAMKYADKAHKFSMFFFDINHGAEILVNALGGNYLSVENGKPTGFNPFQLPATPDNLDFLNQFMRLLLKGSGQPISATDELKIDEAIRSVMSMDKPLRRLSTVMQNITEGTAEHERENSIPRRLAKWYGNGSYAWVFDNQEDLIDLESKPVLGLDGTDFLNNSVTGAPVSFYLLHRVKKIIDGRRGIIFMDEFWAWLNDEAFRDFAESELKTIRKKNAVMVFATQSPSDVLKNDIARTVVEQTSTQIFLPNSQADETEYVEFFKATKQEFDFVRNLNPKSRAFLVKQLGSSSLVRLNLASFPDEMTVFSSTYENVEIMKDIRIQLREFGLDADNPEVWLPLFYEAVRERKQKTSSI